MISEVMLAAVNHLQHHTSYGELDIKIISDKEYRLPPEEFYPLGRLGIDIELEGRKVFLGHETMAESILVYGNLVADDFVCYVLEHEKNEKTY